MWRLECLGGRTSLHLIRSSTMGKTLELVSTNAGQGVPRVERQAGLLWVRNYASRGAKSPACKDSFGTGTKSHKELLAGDAPQRCCIPYCRTGT